MANEKKINVLVVEDSSVARMFLVQLLDSDPQIQVIATAQNGREALQLLAQIVPDVILMDVEMPEMDGLETTRRIMETGPVPIVICSGSSNTHEKMTTFRLMEAGALAIVDKPPGADHREFQASTAQLLQIVKLMSEVKVVRRWPRRPNAIAPPPLARAARPVQAKPSLIGIGASTGGPPVLHTILMSLPRDFPVPLLIVQHIAPGFLDGMVQWLNQVTGFNTLIATSGTRPLPGHAYLAPDDHHLTVRSDGLIMLTREEPQSGLRPSVGRMFRSLAEVYGGRSAGVLLTGMGKDGAAELKLMKDRGAFTIAQDRESSIVHGMPGEAIALGGASCVLSADLIGAALITLAGRAPV